MEVTVEPVRNKVKIKQMHQYLKGRDKKYALLFKFGLNTGLRISDFLPLKVKDIYLGNGMFKEHLNIKREENRQGKENKNQFRLTENPIGLYKDPANNPPVYRD